MNHYTNYFQQFVREDKHFLQNIYPNLSDVTKEYLWSNMIISEMMYSGGEGQDGLAIFTPANLQKWRMREPKIEQFLDGIIASAELFSPWYEGCGWDDCATEIERRLNRK